MSLVVVLVCVAALLIASILGAATARTRAGTPIVYGLSLIACAVAPITALYQLLSDGTTPTLVLPLALPWLGAHFRIDALSAFFPSPHDIEISHHTPKTLTHTSF